jgi:hypothetical protein
VHAIKQANANDKSILVIQHEKELKEVTRDVLAEKE